MALMLQTFIEKGVTPDNVQAFSQLCQLKERAEDRQSERDFNASFAKMQQELPVIVAESVIPNRGKYARFEEVMRQIQPMLTGNGFSVSFEQQSSENRITVTCHLRHIGGHSASTPFTVRLGGKADSDTQADCKASTTAKRNALLQALNIVVRQDVFQDEDDPHNESHDKVTQHQADELRELCDETGSSRIKFLEFADAASFEGINASRFNDLVAMLNRKRK